MWYFVLRQRRANRHVSFSSNLKSSFYMMDARLHTGAAWIALVILFTDVRLAT